MPIKSGNTGKFQSAFRFTKRDVGNFSQEIQTIFEGSFCKEKRKNCPYGKMNGKTWMLYERGREYKAISLFFENNARLQRNCKTPGCLNPKHYSSFKKDEEMKMSTIKELFIKAGKELVTITLPDEIAAKRLRLRLYDARKKYPLEGERIEIRRKGNILELEDKEASFARLLEGSGVVLEREKEESAFDKAWKDYETNYLLPSLEREKLVKRSIVAEDPAADVLARLGYTSPHTRTRLEKEKNPPPSQVDPLAPATQEELAYQQDMEKLYSSEVFVKMNMEAPQQPPVEITSQPQLTLLKEGEKK